MFSSSAARPSKRQRRDYPITPLDHESMTCVAASTIITTPVINNATPITTTKSTSLIPRPIVTTPVSMLDKDIILERFVKEIVQHFDLSLSIPRGNKITTTGRTTTTTTILSPYIQKPRRRATKSLKRRILDQRMIIGSNQCTRALMESSLKTKNPKHVANGDHDHDHHTGKDDHDDVAPLKVQLLLVCRDVHPPTILAHVMTFGTTMAVPIALLPGRSTLELGHALGIRRTAIVAFVSSQQQKQQEHVNGEQNTKEDKSTTSEENNMSLTKESPMDNYDNNEEEEEMMMIKSYHARIDSFIEFVKSKIPCPPTAAVATKQS